MQQGNSNERFRSPLGGVSMIMVTPFREDESLDLESLGRYVRWAADQGVSSVVPLGIMGEAHRLADDERRQVLRATIEAAGDAVKVVAGITSEGTAVAVNRAKEAADLGAAAVMAAPPRNIRPGPALKRHYEQIASATDLDVVVQDEPVTTGVVMPGPFIGELLEMPTITHVKVEESPTIPKVSAILDAAPHALCMGGLGGMYVLEELQRGAIGIMTGFAVPNVLVQICEAFEAGDVDRARDVFFRMLPIIRYEAQLGIGGVAIRKAFLAAQGVIDTSVVRSPGVGADEKTLAELTDLASYLQVL